MIENIPTQQVGQHPAATARMYDQLADRVRTLQAELDQLKAASLERRIDDIDQRSQSPDVRHQQWRSHADSNPIHHLPLPSLSRIKLSQNKLTREIVGIFDPHFEDHDGIGRITDGKLLIYTDVVCFRERLMLTEDDPEHAIAQQIKALWPTLMAGPALDWWINELTYDERTEHRKSLNEMCSALLHRFRPDAAMATKRFNDSGLSLRDLIDNDNALSDYIAKKMRWARAMGIVSEKNGNWHGAMIQIWSNMSLGIRQYLRAPNDIESFGEYQRVITNSRAILLAAAHDKYPKSRRSRTTPSESPRISIRDNYYPAVTHRAAAPTDTNANLLATEVIDPMIATKNTDAEKPHCIAITIDVTGSRTKTIAGKSARVNLTTLTNKTTTNHVMIETARMTDGTRPRTESTGPGNPKRYHLVARRRNRPRSPKVRHTIHTTSWTRT
ncbi:uncharacterized protein BCR38DRAFT_121126 [Pseudomassariella vexata]|uniref:Uncharacterized protein n=1 Tax=Pseudomassariella vexata TaxID=1141098 RepID=A0A1Y2D9L9_9PEZI|nr:uncharacterized protein BCR38DRAFT_121126 [Pseudomassariella vexata]ORY55826.1 hypothetical protein BCR38DRAFT_121126 [Pseudomassariella vexata]